MPSSMKILLASRTPSRNLVFSKHIAVLSNRRPKMVGTRLYSRAIFMGFRRAMRTQSSHTALLKIEGLTTPKDAHFYCGKVRCRCYRFEAFVAAHNPALACSGDARVAITTRTSHPLR